VKESHPPPEFPQQYKEVAQMSMNELESKIHDLRELRRMAEELQAEMDSITDSIKAHMDNQGVDTLTGMDWKATYKTVTSSRVDTSALKKELPEIAQRFSKTTTTRRFCVA
jgi:predicted phage-related endonuclease